MAELFKFRCYQCQKLIGTTSSKFGRVVHCPRCGVELIVPSPDSEESSPEESDPESFRPEDLGLNLEIERLAPPKVAPLPIRDPNEPDPIAFLAKVSEVGDLSDPEIQDEPNSIPVGSPDETDSVPGESRNEANPPPGPDLPEPMVEPLVARKRGGRAARPDELTSRARDVVMPRTAFVAWAMFALFSLAFAFAAGLSIGHYLWK